MQVATFFIEEALNFVIPYTCIYVYLLHFISMCALLFTLVCRSIYYHCQMSYHPDTRFQRNATRINSHLGVLSPLFLFGVPEMKKKSKIRMTKPQSFWMLCCSYYSYLMLYCFVKKNDTK